jgi:hypothetical protein
LRRRRRCAAAAAAPRVCVASARRERARDQRWRGWQLGWQVGRRGGEESFYVSHRTAFLRTRRRRALGAVPRLCRSSPARTVRTDTATRVDIPVLRTGTRRPRARATPPCANATLERSGRTLPQPEGKGGFACTGGRCAGGGCAGGGCAGGGLQPHRPDVASTHLGGVEQRLEEVLEQVIRAQQQRARDAELFLQMGRRDARAKRQGRAENDKSSRAAETWLEIAHYVRTSGQ